MNADCGTGCFFAGRQGIGTADTTRPRSSSYGAIQWASAGDDGRSPFGPRYYWRLDGYEPINFNTWNGAYPLGRAYTDESGLR